jgi:hypothetical protein
MNDVASVKTKCWSAARGAGFRTCVSSLPPVIASYSVNLVPFLHPSHQSTLLQFPRMARLLSKGTSFSKSVGPVAPSRLEAGSILDGSPLALTAGRNVCLANYRSGFHWNGPSVVLPPPAIDGKGEDADKESSSNPVCAASHFWRLGNVETYNFTRTPLASCLP